MTAKFSICLATTDRTPEERRELLVTLAASAAAVMAPPVWAVRVHGTEMVQGAWNDAPIDVPKDWVVCFYPRARSSVEGAWLIEIVGDAEVWTLSLPIALLNTRSDDVLDVLWRMSDVSLPCIGGEEYSMAAVHRSATDVLVEAVGAGSLATYAVVHTTAALKDWSVLRRDGDRVLLARRLR